MLFADASDLFYFQEKYDDENSSEKTNNNNNETTIVATGGNSTQPQQIFHVSVEYEEPDVKIKPEQMENSRKRHRIVKEKTAQQQLLNQYVSQLQPISSMPKQTPTIVIDEKSQDQDMKNSSEVEEPLSKTPRTDDSTKSDKFDIFGMFVASEMRNMKTLTLQRKLKKKILECILEINDLDSDQNT